MLQNTYPVINLSNLVFDFQHQTGMKIQVVPLWQKVIKRSLDIVIASGSLIMLLPLLIYIAIKIKLDSAGPVFYFQERIGLRGIPFVIFKFRSMYEHSEVNGPALSFPNDKRITSWGNTIRKWKLDELPQLLNIIIGDMSLVGPRPERKYYIDKVSETYPYFKYLCQVKPGLTSLGMIKFGYAQNVEQIIKRMKYDIAYLESYSLYLDLQIIYYTLLSVIGGGISTTSLKLRKNVHRMKGKLIYMNEPDCQIRG